MLHQAGLRYLILPVIFEWHFQKVKNWLKKEPNDVFLPRANDFITLIGCQEMKIFYLIPHLNFRAMKSVNKIVTRSVMLTFVQTTIPISMILFFCEFFSRLLWFHLFQKITPFIDSTLCFFINPLDFYTTPARFCRREATVQENKSVKWIFADPTHFR